MNQIALKRALDAKTPPSAFLVLPFGDLETVKGTFKFNAKDAQAVLAQRADRGVDLQIDYEHASIQKPGDIAEGAPAAGWFKLELRDDGLWATDVHWTPRATEFLKNGEYRYFSPVLAFDKDGHIKRLINLALTNDPAIKDLPPLVALKAGPVSYESAPVVDGPWDANAAEGRLRKWASSDGSGDKDTIDWAKHGKGFAYVSGAGDEFGDFHEPHHDVRDGKLVTVKRGVEAAAQRLSQTDIPPSDVASVKHHLAEHYHQWGGTAPWESHSAATGGQETQMALEPKHLEDHEKALKACTDALSAHGKGMEALKASMDGLTEKFGKKPGKTNLDAADGDDDTAAMSAKLPAEVVALTGKTGQEALGTVMGWRDGAGQLAALKTELAELKTKEEKRERDGLIEEALKAGKIVPAQKDWAQKLELTVLKSYLAATPANALVQQVAEQKDGEPVPTETDRMVALNMGVDLKKYMEIKKDELARQKAQQG